MTGVAPPQRLAVLRVVIGAFAVVYLAVRMSVFLGLRDNDPDAFEPVGVLWWMRSPAAAWLVVAIVIATLGLGVLFTAGAAFRATGPAFAVLLLALTTYRSSWGQLLWFENLMVLHVLIVGFSRAADALSFDS